MTPENRGLRIGELARQSGLSVDTLRHERAAGRAPCRAVRRLAQAKFEALEQHIRRLLAGREALHALLEHWDERLNEAQGQPARLLDSLAELEPFPANLSPRLPRKRSR